MTRRLPDATPVTAVSGDKVAGVKSGAIKLFDASPSFQQLVATTGAGMIGYSPDQTYDAGTLGKACVDTGVDAAAVAADRAAVEAALATSPSAAALAANLAAPTGAGIVGTIAAGTGAVATDLQTAMREISVSVTGFSANGVSGAKVDPTNTTDSYLGIQAALTAVGNAGGGFVLVPPGTYKCSASIALPAKTWLVGWGRKTSILAFTHTGDGITSIWGINGNTAVYVGVRDIGLTCTNASNTSGGFVDVGGSYVDLSNVYLNGWKYNVIFDQTEHGTIDRCESVQAAYSTAGLWLVNGADHTALASKNFTNRITVTRCQFNAAFGALYNILDDGGGNHSYRDNNFNAGHTGLRAAGSYGFIFSGNESEVHAGEDIYLADTTLAGDYVGPSVGFDISGNELISGSGGRNIAVQNGANGKITANVFGQAAAAINFINGAANRSSGIVIEANEKLISGAGITAGPFVNGFSRSLSANIIRQVAATYSVASCTGGTITITPATMEYISGGTLLHLVNADGTNGEDVVVSSVTSTTFTAPLNSAKAAYFQIRG